MPELQIENGVLIGLKGELFLAGGRHDVLEYASGRRRLDPAAVQAFLQNLRRRAARAAKLGCGFLHILVPDKQSVLRERFPLPLGPSLGEILLGRCGAEAAHLLYPAALLRAAAAERPVFRQTDTHLGSYGSLLVACEAVARLMGEPQEGHLRHLAARLTGRHTAPGDLGAKLAPPRQGTDAVLRPDWRHHRISNHAAMGGLNNGIVDILVTKSPVHRKRLLIFGDSFLRGCLPALSYFFEEILFLRTPFLHDDILQQHRPDLVLTGNVERYLPSVVPDGMRPNFLLYPALAGAEYRPDPRFAEAFSAVLAHGRPPHAAFLEGLWAEPALAAAG